MIHILLSTDANYIMPSVVMMKSVSSHHLENDLCFHVMIDESVKDKHKQQMKSALEKSKHSLRFYLMNKRFFRKYPSLGSVKSYLSQAAYYRLFLTDVLPNDIHKIIYLDSDIIVIKSLIDLWNIDISNLALGTVTDMAEDRQDFERLNYNQKFGYFNSGVLLINVDYWRKHHLKQQFMDLIKNHPERIVLHDQDVLNIILHDQKYNLPMKYNVQNGFLWKKEYNQFGDKYDEYEADLKDAISNPIIIHYTDNKKPWHTEDCNPLGYLWYKYYKQTEWKYVALGHCNKSKIRYWGAKVLRALRLIGLPKTEEEFYYSTEELDSFKK